MTWGYVAVGAGTLGAGLLSSNAADSAASSQDRATSLGIGESSRQFDQTRLDQAPYRDAGSAALAQLGIGLGFKTPDTVYSGKSQQELSDIIASLKQQKAATNDPLFDREISAAMTAFNTGAASYAGSGMEPGSLNRKFTLSDFWSDPVTQASYQSGLDQGKQALDRSGASRGSLNSGSQLKALLRFGTDYTGQQAGASQQRFVGDQTNTYNRLAGISGTGQTSVAQTGNAGISTGQNIAQMLTSQGNARGAAAIASGNAWGGAAQNIGNWWQQQQFMNRLYPQTPASLTGAQPNYLSGAAGGYG